MPSATLDFQALFNRKPHVMASAPGRVNLIGEHTDYNGGYVLPTTIPQKTHVELALRGDYTVRAWSADAPANSLPLEYRLGHETRRGQWIDYVQGITRVLAREGSRLTGFDLRIQSDIPVGSGLSSSAALGVSLLRGLQSSFGFDLDEIHLARLVQRAENEFVGAPVGILDPMACTLGTHGEALFIDTRSLVYERVPIPSGAELVVLDSGISHDHAGGDYRIRRAECEEAAALLGVRELRDLEDVHVGAIDDLLSTLPDLYRRRARHVITENVRVLEAVRALRSGDLHRLGWLFYASHDSMRVDYEVSVPDIDLMIDLARNEASIYGARMTGGGFGGSVVMLAHAGAGRAVGTRIAETYGRRTGRTPGLLVPKEALEPGRSPADEATMASRTTKD